MEDILDIIVLFIERGANFVCIPFINEPRYRLGFIMGAALTILTARTAMFILYARAQIIAFFNPSALPATRPGPSGSDKMQGCGSGVIKLTGVAIVALLILAAVAIYLFG